MSSDRSSLGHAQNADPASSVGPRVLVTGGTGSLGSAVVGMLLARNKVQHITIYSRDELKQYEMQQAFPNESRLGYFLGDVRDSRRLVEACEGQDAVIHTAALKQVVMGEHNPTEYIRTNIEGTINVAEAAIAQRVSRVLIVSTDKASSPVNLYGATKLVADKYIVRTAVQRTRQRVGSPIMGVVRFGNFLNSRGSVIPVWAAQRYRGEPLTLTDPEMTRFWLTLRMGAEATIRALEVLRPGEVIIPKCSSMSLGDLAQAFAPGFPVRITGRRLGEKMHEELVSEADYEFLLDAGDFYRVCPSGDSRSPQEAACDAVTNSRNGGGQGLALRSDDPALRLTVRDLSLLLGELDTEVGGKPPSQTSS